MDQEITKLADRLETADGAEELRRLEGEAKRREETLRRGVADWARIRALKTIRRRIAERLAALEERSDPADGD